MIDNGTVVPLIMAVLFVAVISIVTVFRPKLEKFWSGYNLSRYHMVDIDGGSVSDDDIELAEKGVELAKKEDE